MPKASEVASELRKLADSLDREPDAKIIPFAIRLYHHGESDKQKFLNLARALPRPYEKKYEGGDLKLVSGQEWEGALSVMASIERSVVCRIVAPAREAVYECEPLLSDEEEAALETAVAE